MGKWQGPTWNRLMSFQGGVWRALYHSPLCLVAEKNSRTARWQTRSDFLEYNTCEAYKWARNALPQELTGLQFHNQRKKWGGREELYCLSWVDVTFLSSVLPPGWAGELSHPRVVKLGLQTVVFSVCRENVLGIINLLSSLGMMWVSCHHCFIVWGHVPCFCCMILLLSKLLGFVIKQTCSLE